MHGFTKVDMSDHKLAKHVKGLPWSHVNNSTQYTKDGVVVAVVIFDNTKCTRDIWIKD